MRGPFAAIAAAGALAALAPGPALACSCVTRGVQEHFEAAAAVFVGRVLPSPSPAASPAAASPTASPPRLVTRALRVEEIYKGEASGVVRVRTPARTVDCGIPFVASRRYLVFAASRAPNGAYRADLCGGTTASAAALRDAGYTPLPSPPPAATVAAPASPGSRVAQIAAASGLAALVGVAAARALGRRRARVR